MHKDDLRQQMAKQRDVGKPAHIYGMNIYKQVVAWSVFQAAHCVACYVSVNKEVETHQLIDEALKMGKKVGVPVTRTQGVMDFQQIVSLDVLKPAQFGLLEPAPCLDRVISPDAVDLVLVPGVAFDRQGNRLGFGGGYYDRYLAQCEAVKVGLAYSFQVVDAVPVEDYDVPMDWLVTELEIVPCHEK